MSSIAYQRARKDAAWKTAADGLRFAGLLVVLVLAALVYSAAQRYFDPDLQFEAAQAFVSP